MPNNCLSVLYKHIIQVENKNVGLKVGGINIPYYLFVYLFVYLYTTYTYTHTDICTQTYIHRYTYVHTYAWMDGWMVRSIDLVFLKYCHNLHHCFILIYFFTLSSQDDCLTTSNLGEEWNLLPKFQRVLVERFFVVFSEKERRTKISLRSLPDKYEKQL